MSIWKLSPILGTIFAERSGGFGAENGVCLDIDLLVYVEGVKIFFLEKREKCHQLCEFAEFGKEAKLDCTTVHTC